MRFRASGGSSMLFVAALLGGAGLLRTGGDWPATVSPQPATAATAKRAEIVFFLLRSSTSGRCVDAYAALIGELQFLKNLRCLLLINARRIKYASAGYKRRLPGLALRSRPS